MKILIVTKFEDGEQKQIIQANPHHDITFISKKKLTETQLKEADIIVGNISEEQLRLCKSLKWLQLDSAGSDQYVKEGVMPKGVRLSNASGTYGLAISEHIICMLLMMMKRMGKYHDNQHQHIWKNEGCIDSIYHANILLLGLGDIGSETGRRLQALGANVYGIRAHVCKKEDYLVKQTTMKELDDLLPQMDAVISCLPNQKETYHIFDESRFAKMKQGSYFINVGRGSAIDLNALLNALDKRRPAFAALDVFEEEPLNKDHPAWDHPSLFMTPHISGVWNLKETKHRFMNIIIENIHHFDQGEPLRSEVDFQSGYRKFKEDK